MINTILALWGGHARTDKVISREDADASSRGTAQGGNGKGDHEIVSSQTKTIANVGGGSPGCGSVTAGRLDDKEHRGVSEHRIALACPGHCRSTKVRCI